MAYTAQYSASDFGPMMFDIFGAFLNVIVLNVNLIVTLAILSILAFLFRDTLRAIFGILLGFKGK